MGEEGDVKEKGYLPEWQSLFSRQLGHRWWLPHVKFLFLWFLWLSHLLALLLSFQFLRLWLSRSCSITASIIIYANDCLSHLSPQSQDIYNSLLTIFTWMSWKHFKCNWFNLGLTIVSSPARCHSHDLSLSNISPPPYSDGGISIYSITQVGLSYKNNLVILAL